MTKPKTNPDPGPGPNSELVSILREIAASIKTIASASTSMAQSARDQADQAKASNRKRGPVITRIGQANYEQREQARQEEGSEVPGFRRK